MRIEVHMTPEEVRERDEWLAIRKGAALKIDPATAQIWWSWAEILDPYGVYPEVQYEASCIGRCYYARSPESDIWVWWGDLPDDVSDKLQQKSEAIGFEDPDGGDFIPF
jgi:hypothetical protein